MAEKELCCVFEISGAKAKQHLGRAKGFTTKQVDLMTQFQQDSRRFLSPEGHLWAGLASLVSRARCAKEAVCRGDASQSHRLASLTAALFNFTDAREKSADGDRILSFSVTQEAFDKLQPLEVGCRRSAPWPGAIWQTQELQASQEKEGQNQSVPTGLPEREVFGIERNSFARPRLPTTSMNDSFSSKFGTTFSTSSFCQHSRAAENGSNNFNRSNVENSNCSSQASTHPPQSEVRGICGQGPDVSPSSSSSSSRAADGQQQRRQLRFDTPAAAC